MYVEREEEQNTLPAEVIGLLDDGVPTADATREWLPHCNLHVCVEDKVDRYSYGPRTQ